MQRETNQAPRSGRIAAGLVGCLLMGGTLGLLSEGQVRAVPTLAADYTESGGTWQGPPVLTVATATQWDDEENYVRVDTRTNYRTVTAQDSPSTYTVRDGDSLWLIASNFNTDIATLVALNPHVRASVLQPGDVLQIAPREERQTHLVAAGETLGQIAAHYGLSVAEIVAANGLASADLIRVGQVLELPGAHDRAERTMLASRGLTAPRRPVSMLWPISGGLHSSEFGEQRWSGPHSGLDIAVPVGTPATAAAAGTVAAAGWDGGYGYSVIIDHGEGVQSRYAHASKILVTVGQQVQPGENVILVGATGNATGPHLHFEVLVDGETQDPRGYLP